MLPGQTRGSEPTSAPALLLLPGSRVGFVSFVSVLSRFCLARVGVVSVLSQFYPGVVSV